MIFEFKLSKHNVLKTQEAPLPAHPPYTDPLATTKQWWTSSFRQIQTEHFMIDITYVQYNKTNGLVKYVIL